MANIEDNDFRDLKIKILADRKAQLGILKFKKSRAFIDFLHCAVDQPIVGGVAVGLAVSLASGFPHITKLQAPDF